ncbi:hypothetical protein [Azospirillum argentinense]
MLNVEGLELVPFCCFFGIFSLLRCKGEGRKGPFRGLLKKVAAESSAGSCLRLSG